MSITLNRIEARAIYKNLVGGRLSNQEKAALTDALNKLKKGSA